MLCQPSKILLSFFSPEVASSQTLLRADLCRGRCWNKRKVLATLGLMEAEHLMVVDLAGRMVKQQQIRREILRKYKLSVL